LTEPVLGAVFEVSNPPGAGFLDRVYQRALLHELLVEKVLVLTDRAVSRLLASLGPESVSARLKRIVHGLQIPESIAALPSAR
jgi:hypothetical protein